MKPQNLENRAEIHPGIVHRKPPLQLFPNFVSPAVFWSGHRTTTIMDPNSIVIVSLHSPREKIWGILLEINPSGVTMRGVDLNSFDHFVSQINQLDAERVGLPTIFFPMTRVERISLDEPAGSIPSMAEIFQRKIGRSLLDYLAQFA
jgi:hypothetical protein